MLPSSTSRQGLGRERKGHAQETWVLPRSHLQEPPELTLMTQLPLALLQLDPKVDEFLAVVVAVCWQRQMFLRFQSESQTSVLFFVPW